MLVAEKQYYPYETYTDVHEKEALGVRTKPRTKRKVKIAGRVKPILGVLIGTVVCAFLLSRYALICINNANINELKKVLKEEQKVVDDLKLELSMADDLEYIKVTAQEKLGMDYPGQGQIHYVEMPSDKKVALQDDAQHDAQENGLLSKLYRLLD